MAKNRQSKIDANNRYDKKTYEKFLLRLSREKDQEVIQWLDEQPSKNGTLRNALIAYMNAQKSKSETK